METETDLNKILEIEADAILEATGFHRDGRPPGEVSIEQKGFDAIIFDYQPHNRDIPQYKAP